jgi:hypothetical protein
LLVAYTVSNQNHFKRIKTFGDNKTKLAVLLFGSKLQTLENEVDIDETQEINRKSLNLELDDNEEAIAEFVYNEIQKIKQSFQFTNLDECIETVTRNYTESGADNLMDVNSIHAFVSKFCYPNLFKDTPYISKTNYLNFKDDLFVSSSEFMIKVI